ncbi:SRPBCC family protein [Caulobacter sp. DWP3-1-3b2]|uniref:SRPBCC family protein n=1 Tax=Caulobacter sp. DWP3-1-3b2 TaxID=2804643 RepID=UPI003CF6FD0B
MHLRNLVAILTAAIALATSAHAAALSPKAQAALARGEAYAEVTPDPDGISGKVSAVIDIEASPAKVWSVMTDCVTAGKMVTNLARCTIVSGDIKRGSDVREHVTHRSLFLPAMRIVFRSVYEPFTRIRFERVGGDLKVEQGEWRLLALRGGAATRVFYENRLAVDLPIPRALLREGLRKDTPKVLLNLRKACLAAA